MRRRHWALVHSFLLIVVLPLVVSAGYLYFRAADRFESTLGFSIHREDVDSAFSLLSGLASISGSSSAESDIIYSFVNSQQLVAEIDEQLDLREMWSRPQHDFVYALHADSTIEDLVDYWKKRVNVYYDRTTRLIEIRVQAFAPEDAQAIAQLIYEKSTSMINRLNDIAVEDSVRFTLRELEKTRDELIVARQDVTAFRNANNIVDPAADVAAQMTIVGSLEQELASTQIDLEILKESSRADDPRIDPLERRIRVIQDRIAIERGKLGLDGDSSEDSPIADLVAKYEELTVDLQYAEAAYQSARAAHEQALSSAQRQTRYLAAHIAPTMAQSARFPDRPVILLVIGLFVTMIWAVIVLVAYSVRDRK